MKTNSMRLFSVLSSIHISVENHCELPKKNVVITPGFVIDHIDPESKALLFQPYGAMFAEGTSSHDKPLLLGKFSERDVVEFFSDKTSPMLYNCKKALRLSSIKGKPSKTILVLLTFEGILYYNATNNLPVKASSIINWGISESSKEQQLRYIIFTLENKESFIVNERKISNGGGILTMDKN